MSGWIGVDLDGTLAHYDGWKGGSHIGAPIPAMLSRVRAWLAEGRTVKIFTARVAVPEPDRSKVIRVVHEWCEANGLPRLDITNVKDIAMVELWDDRAIRVISNTGEPPADLSDAWLERSAAALAGMVIDYVDGGIRSNQDWRRGLGVILHARLQRLARPQKRDARPSEAREPIQPV